MITLVKNEPALKYNEYLIITDLHLGIEKEYQEKGYEIPSQTQETLNRIKKIKGKSTKIIILGDLKHNIPTTTRKEEQEIQYFINELKKTFQEVIIIKGNHDGNLERITPCVKEYIHNDTAFIHGHTINEKTLKNKKIIAGHTHPTYTYKNHLGIKQTSKAWIITKKIIIIPAFTNLSSGSNELAKPLAKHVKNPEILLLNHTKVQ